MREQGYYWIWYDLHAGWEVAYWHYMGWRTIGAEYDLQDTDLIEIDERLIVREETADGR
ncbi:MAG: hypothetical protein ACRCXB_14080 [Aeromonadaceae bacterium]